MNFKGQILIVINFFCMHSEYHQGDNLYKTLETVMFTLCDLQLFVLFFFKCYKKKQKYRRAKLKQRGECGTKSSEI